MLKSLKIVSNPNVYFDVVNHMFTKEYNADYIPLRCNDITYLILERWSINGLFDDCYTYDDLINFELK